MKPHIVFFLLFLSIPAFAYADLVDELSFDSVEDLLVDQSRSNFVDNGDGVFSSGDVLYGFVAIDQIDLSNDGLNIATVARPNEIVITYSAQFNSFDPTTNTWSLGATTTAGFELSTLLDPAISAQLSNPSDSIFAIVDGTTSVDATDESIFGSLSDFNAANGLSYVASGGFATGSDDFFQFSEFGTFGFEAAGFSFFDHTFGGGVNFLPVSANPLDGSTTNGHELVLLNGIIFDNATGSVWDLQNNSDFLLNVVPEPSTSLVLCIASLGLVRRRR